MSIRAATCSTAARAVRLPCATTSRRWSPNTDQRRRPYCNPIGKDAYSYGEAIDGQEAGCLAGDSGTDGAKDPGGEGRHARIWNRPADRAGQRGPPDAELWDLVPGAAEAGAGGL